MLLRNWKSLKNLPNIAMNFQNLQENWLFGKGRVFYVWKEFQILVEISTPAQIKCKLFAYCTLAVIRHTYIKF